MRRNEVDAYIAEFAPSVRKQLQAMRKAIRAAAPQAQEKLSYQMPTYYLNGNLVHFAAFKNHIGLYPTPSGVTAFEEELGAYVHSKGAIQFPMGEPLPLSLVKRITQFRVKENLGKKPVQRRAAG